ncbi:hypothetical protein DFQ28_010149 [Apophysomyces sp. BC1034]|nr:hypothetical protein DFQ30_006634 [Apophysomyces sp. BC1015]KAG0176822.1 hypothetical protein DFQ29_005596 [Apophysomyces sp. BC1021]KAG0184986.1 hypothetical protein DFQ28_010149 [Apophysomyces sp. BC1034]
MEPSQQQTLADHFTPQKATTQPINAGVDESQLNLRRQLEDLAFGSIAGMVGKFVEYPFDTVKVRLQTQPADRPYFSGPVDCIAATLKNEGLRGLYKGMASPLFGSMVENAALFVGYRQVQRIIRTYSATAEEAEQMASMSEERLPPLSMTQLVVAGTASGALASIVLTPVELIKCKLQVQLAGPSIKPTYTGPLHVITHTLRQHGPSGFYRGYLATLIREAGGGAFWFGMYEYTCALLMRRRERLSGKRVTKKDLTAPELMLGGAIGGMSYNASFFPVDVIKSQMQTDEELLAATRKRTFLQTTREIYAGAGIRGFYRGCGITVLRSAPTSAIIFMTYELLIRHFGL